MSLLYCAIYTDRMVLHVQAAWEPMLKKAGFKLEAVHSTRGFFWVLTADPV